MNINDIKRIIQIDDADIAIIEKILSLSFCDTRKRILKDNKTIDVQACPGSGKTTLIATKLILLAEKWNFPHQGICVLSHTNVAKNEIIKRIDKSESKDAKNLLSYPHFIGTIQEFADRYLAIPYLKSCGFVINAIDDDITKAKINNPNNEITYENRGYKGYFLYKDMFQIANQLIEEYPKIIQHIQKKFPYIFIDEMQDTSKLQNIIVQRFGDKDQAIMGFKKDDPLNISYNNKDKFGYEITDTNRFNSTISDKIKHFSITNIGLHSSIRENNKKYEHTIFLYDSNNINQVINAFVKMCKIELQDIDNLQIKVVGAYGYESKNQITIKNYYSDFDKNHFIKKFLPKNKIEALNFIVDAIHYQNMSFYDAYHILIKAKSRIDNIDIEEARKEVQKCNKKIFDHIVNHKPSANQDLEKTINKKNIDNIFEIDGLKVHFSTIHGVKGETHDATLVLETSYNQKFDISSCIDLLLEKPVTGLNDEIKKLYVAMSRPKHLLCLATNKNKIDTDTRETLKSIGWKINIFK
jgi:superfamily I DNA/RNA helicase